MYFGTYVAFLLFLLEGGGAIFGKIHPTPISIVKDIETKAETFQYQRYGSEQKLKLDLSQMFVN
jgi:hypothetical protein